MGVAQWISTGNSLNPQCPQKSWAWLSMVVYTFNLSSQEAEAEGSPEFKAILVYTPSSRIARTDRESLSPKKQTKPNQTKPNQQQQQQNKTQKLCLAVPQH